MHYKELIRKRFRDARIEMGLSQRKLAELVEVTQATVSNWEIGRMEPTIDNYLKLCIALKISFPVLFEGTSYEHLFAKDVSD